MKQVSDLYGYQVELYRRYSLTPEEALTDSTDYAARYEIFEEIAGLVDRLVLTGRYDDGGLLRMWARLTPASGAAGPRGEQAVAP